jgi:hypothetical protein
MQKIILSLFCPALVAIVVRIVLFLLALILAIGGRITREGRDFFKFCDTIGGFETFVWDQSWGFWAIVIILTFIAEMIIWDKDFDF